MDISYSSNIYFRVQLKIPLKKPYFSRLSLYASSYAFIYTCSYMRKPFTYNIQKLHICRIYHMIIYLHVYIERFAKNLPQPADYCRQEKPVPVADMVHQGQKIFVCIADSTVSKIIFGNLVGPTLRCILVFQKKHLKFKLKFNFTKKSN